MTCPYMLERAERDQTAAGALENLQVGVVTYGALPDTETGLAAEVADRARFIHGILGSAQLASSPTRLQ